MVPEVRREFAENLCFKVCNLYSDDIIVAAIYGSTARETDTFWSDLELQFVVRDKSKLKTKHFIYQEIAVGLHIIKQIEMEEKLTFISLYENRLEVRGCRLSLVGYIPPFTPHCLALITSGTLPFFCGHRYKPDQFL